MPASIEQQVRTAARLYECRQTLRTLNGAKYEERLRPWAELVASVASEHTAGNETQAVMFIVRDQERRTGRACEPFSVMWLSAAAVELIEAKEKRPAPKPYPPNPEP